MKPHFKLLLALVLGAVMGSILHSQGDVAWLSNFNTHFLAPIGQIFLRLIFMVVVPLVLSGLVIGVYQLSQSHGLKRVVWRTLAFTGIASTASVLIGITLVNVLKPGRGFHDGRAPLSVPNEAVDAIARNATAAKPFSQILVDIIPRNPIDAALRALDGEMVSLMFFALLFGLALARFSSSKGEEKKPDVMLRLFEQIFGASMKIVGLAMRFAPLAIFAIVFNTAFKFGHSIFASIAFYVVVVVLGLLIQQFVVYPGLLKAMTRRSPWQFFKSCREVYLYAFATASSNATLPKTIETAEKQLKIPTDVSRFVLTVGSTANQNGTALFEGVTVLFLAQVYAIDLSLAQQVQVVAMSILAGIGTAGIPGGSLPLIMILLLQLGIPAEGMALILGVDRFLDMCRTTLNVSGDLVIAALVSEKHPGRAA